MSDKDVDWGDLEPIESRHQEILLIFQNEPDSIFTPAEIAAQMSPDIDKAEDVTLNTAYTTICSDLAFQGQLETRLDENGDEYLRLAE